MKKLLICVLLVFTFSTCTAQKDSKITFSGEAQGTYYSITYYDDQKRDFQSEVELFFKNFDQIISLWEPQSIVCKTNRNESVVLDSVFVDIFQKSQSVCGITDGAFDFTIGPLTAAWGFGFSKKQKLNHAKVDSLLQIVDYRKVKIENRLLVKENPKIQLDFNAIAKGYSVDMLAAFLESKGVENYLINVGGEIIAKGLKPNHSQWIVGIEKPAESKNASQQIQSKIGLTNLALATSGNYRKYYEEDGIRYSHTISPKTGYPVVHSLLSASVLAKNCWEADAYATAFMVMGLGNALKLLKTQPQLEAYFIFYEDGEFKTFATEGFQKLILQ